MDACDNAAKPVTYRPVSTLSAGQLAHKRHWDRARQRNYRSSAKNQIRELEEELRDVAARLEAAEKERDSLRARLLEQPKAAEDLQKECRRLRDIIKSAFSEMQACGEREKIREATPEQQAFRGGSEGGSTAAKDCPGSNLSVDESYATESSGQELSGPRPGVSEVCISLDSLTDIWPVPSPSPQAAGLQRYSRDGILRFDHAQLPQLQSTISDSLGRWSMMPVNTAPMAALDWAVVEMEELCWNKTSKDMAITEFTTPAFPHVSSLLNPQTRPAHPQQPITSAVVTRILSQMPVGGTTERLGAMWLLCNLVRWRLCRTRETFAALPEFLRPTETQLTIPHPIWMDVIVWPAVRDRLIQEFDYTEFDVFRYSIGSSLSLGWTNGLSACLSLTDTLDEYSLSLEFENHLRHLSNWTVDAAFVEEFRFLDGAINVRSS